MNSEPLKELRLSLVSLHSAPDSGVDQAWNDEIVRRIEQIESGDIALLSRDESRRKMQEAVGYWRKRTPE